VRRGPDRLDPRGIATFEEWELKLGLQAKWNQVNRGVGGKAKAKSVISLNERAQTCRPSKHALSLTSNDRFEAPRGDA
jgi:hypothetical protein